MRITFKRLEIHNFKSFADETFDFEKHDGLNLVCGKNLDIAGAKNGCGKSALIGALVFSLFGQTQSNSRNCNIANKWLSDKEVRVATYFDIGERSFKVVSGFNKYNNQYCELSEFTKDGEVVLTKSTMSETRSFLEKELLHCDFSIFMRTVLLSSDQNYNFFMLRKGEKKEFIEKLFDISIFGDMFNHIHYDINQLDKKLNNAQNTLMMLNRNNDTYVEKLNEFEQNSKKQKEQLDVKKAELEKTIAQMKDQQLTVNSSEVSKYESYLEKVSEASRQIADKIRQLNVNEHKDDVKANRLQTAKTSKQKDIDKHSEMLSRLCDHCRPVISDYYNLNVIQNEISEINQQLNSIAKAAKDRKDAISKLESTQQACADKTDKINQKLKDLTSEYAKYVATLAQLEEKLQSIDREIFKNEQQVNPYVTLKEQNDIELNSESTKLSELEERYRYLKFAEGIVSQESLRKFIISDLIGLLNNKIKTYLTKFGAKYEVVFDSDMNYRLYSDSHEFDYGDFSGGERSRLMIAVCFAFRDFMYIRNNFSSNILFLDEFIDGAIDSLAMENILNILAEYSDQYEQNVFIISHRKSEMDNTVFDHIIQVVKKDNISKITYVE